ncbi:hypothetical protein ES703_74457 [subsurface metagenome]
MKVLRVAVENKRWDLVAHTIVLATASILKNGDKPHTGKGVSGNSPLKTSGVKRVVKTGGKRA